MDVCLRVGWVIEVVMEIFLEGVCNLGEWYVRKIEFECEIFKMSAIIWF
ncbi:hypothetical protein GCM10008967_38170 [Bacillus carboniphilus]|uniref:Uncharacterized protein n=1 Tax=Bacillus carboniphilus TaxID=86663 RepID=A0ABP3GFD1_9BACI